jgi:uncharacterized protein YyaL (SSP411 family)
MRLVADAAANSPISFGTSLALMSELAAASTQLVIVTPDAASRDESAQAADASQAMVNAARHAVTAGVCAVVTQEQAAEFQAGGFELFEGRGSVADAATAYYCTDFVCKLPTTSAHELAALLTPVP